MVRNEDGIVVGFETEGEFTRYRNDDERADEIGVWLLGTFLDKIKNIIRTVIPSRQHRFLPLLPMWYMVKQPV